MIGEVLTKEKHANADRLNVATVKLGQDQVETIVCGAPNLEVGQKVIVATPGTTIHPIKGKPFKIKKSKIRGVVSKGMICAEDEIGLGESHDGIMVLPDDAEPGMQAKDYFPKSNNESLADEANNNVQKFMPIEMKQNRRRATGFYDESSI